MKRYITAVQVIMFILIIGFLGGYENGGTFSEFIGYSIVPAGIICTGQVIKGVEKYVRKKQFGNINRGVCVLRTNEKRGSVC